METKSLNSSAEMPPRSSPAVAAAQKAHPQSATSFSEIRFRVLANSKKIPQAIYIFFQLVAMARLVLISPFFPDAPHACYSKSSRSLFPPQNSLLRLIEISKRYILFLSLPEKKKKTSSVSNSRPHETFIYASKQGVVLPLAIHS